MVADDSGPRHCAFRDIEHFRCFGSVNLPIGILPCTTMTILFNLGGYPCALPFAQMPAAEVETDAYLATRSSSRPIGPAALPSSSRVIALRSVSTGAPC